MLILKKKKIQIKGFLNYLLLVLTKLSSFYTKIPPLLNLSQKRPEAFYWPFICSKTFIALSLLTATKMLIITQWWTLKDRICFVFVCVCLSV